ncbi:MAG: DUF4212 domain-containing protein [Bacteroidales bacterium]|nr:DUF4212 domain-containing protein [Bacteroidales bacterium]
MKKNILTHIINYTMVVYLAVWAYYAIFNWDVFSIKLNTNAGFSVIGGYPFAFFFLIGIAALLILKYFINMNIIEYEKREKDSRHKMAIMEKDIELLKMKEVLFKMQTSEMGKNSSHLDALHKKLDELSNTISQQNSEEKTDENGDKPAE